MKQIRKIVALLAMLCMVLSLCACGDASENKEKNDDTNVQDVQNDNQSDDKSEDKTKEAAFKVKVVDKDGNPVSGVYVQICKDSCIFAETNAEGIAGFDLVIEEGHKLSVLECPEGYSYTGEAEVYLDAGITDYTLTLEDGQ